MNTLEQILEIYGEDIIGKANTAEGFDDAAIGVDEETMRIIYSEKKMIQVLMERDGMSDVEAREFLSYNTFGSYGTPNDLPRPIWCRDVDL